MSTASEALVKEARRIQEFSLWNSAAHFNAAVWVGRIHGVLGTIAAVLGGIGGWKGIVEEGDAASVQLLGALALLAGLLGSLLSLWDLTGRRQAHFVAGTKYKTLENQSRRAHEVYSAIEAEDRLRERIESLAERYDELGETSALSSDLGFWFAKRKIRKCLYEPDPPTSTA